MKLTFYLFDETVTEFDQAVAPKKIEGDDPFQEVAVTTGLAFESRLYLQQNRETTPKWLAFFAPHCELNPNEVVNTTNSMLLLIKAGGRVFGITAGFGFTAVNREKMEMGFGLRVTLNEIDPAKIKGLDSRKIDTTTKQKRVIVNADSQLAEFDFDLDEDMLNLIAGQPSDGALARKLSGSDSLSVTGDFGFGDLGQKCEALLTAFMKDTYKQHFPFIDRMRMVKEPLLRAAMDKKLAAAINSRASDKLLLAYPEIDFWSTAEKYKIVGAGIRPAPEVEDVTLDSLYKVLDEANIAHVDPHRLKIIGLDHEGHPVTPARPLYDYAVYEIDHDGQRYLLSLKRWFQLAVDYVAEVNQAVDGIEEIPQPGYLPSIREGEKEGTYNDRAANASRACLDCDNFTRLPGQSRIEVCDLLTTDLEFICVKRYNGSSTLSHLFSQGYVSAMLFHDYRAYRAFVGDKVNARLGNLFNVDSPTWGDFTFVYAIAHKRDGSLAGNLPFFSKVNLRHFTREIERMGFNVKIVRIPYKQPGEEDE